MRSATWIELWHTHPAGQCPRPSANTTLIARHEHPDGNPFATRWRRREASPREIARWRNAFGNTNVFGTLNRYFTPERQENEPFVSDFAIDLDSTDIEACKEDAIRLVDCLASEMDVQHPRVYFSGSKGFHIEVPFELLDLSPDPAFHRALKIIAKEIASTAKTQTLDLSIYSVRQAWRFANSKNLKSGLFKIPLSPKELRSSAKEIRRLAQSPRIQKQPIFAQPAPRLAALAATARTQAAAEETTRRAETRKRTSLEIETGAASAIPNARVSSPPCIKELLRAGITPKGLAKGANRNIASLILAEWLKATGVSVSAAAAAVVQHAQTVLTPFSTSSPEEIAASAAGTVKTVYANPEYVFRCRVTRSKGYPCSSKCPLCR